MSRPPTETNPFLLGYTTMWLIQKVYGEGLEGLTLEEIVRVENIIKEILRAVSDYLPDIDKVTEALPKIQSESGALSLLNKYIGSKCERITKKTMYL